MIPGTCARRTLTSILVASGLLALVARPANAGGTWLEFERDNYRPGDEVHATAFVTRGQLGWAYDGPFFARLRADHGYGDDPDEDVLLGPVTLTNESKTSIDVTVEFVVPDVPPGEWWVVVCNDGCQEGLGDLIGGTIEVGSSPGASDILPRTGLPASPLLGAALAFVGILLLAVARRSRFQG